MWTKFHGVAENAGANWLLRPTDDSRIEIEMAFSDVKLDGQLIEVRVGATALRLEIPENSLVNMTPIRKSAPLCVGGRSRCVGGIEYCCNDQVAGPCNGSWNGCRTEVGKPNNDLEEFMLPTTPQRDLERA